MTKNWHVSVFLAVGASLITGQALGQAGLQSGSSQAAQTGGTPAVAAAAPGPVLAQAPAAPPQAAQPTQSPTAGTPPSGEPPPGIDTAVTVQPLAIDAGAAILLHLPGPAATVIAADPRVVRVQAVSPSSMFLVGISPGRTNLIATNEAGRQIAQYEVTVNRGGGGGGSGPRDQRGASAAAVQTAIRQNVPGAAGVQVVATEGNLILKGSVATPAQAEQVEVIARSMGGTGATVIDQMTVRSSTQVNVRVRIAEMSRDLTRNLGFNWQAIGKLGNNVTLGLLTPGAAAGTLLSPFAAGSGAGNSNNLIGGHYVKGGTDINGVIDALALDNLITILAEPNLTTQSGEPASFLAGGEFPIPIASGGGNAPGVEFKQFGVSLAFVPTVLSAGRINMRIRPEVSERDDAHSITIDGSVIPSITTRRAETTVELGSGQSFAIAGLLQRKVVNDLSTLPWIGEVPVLGALFRSTQFQRSETEVVIIVTPYIVQPVDNTEQLRTLSEGFQPATDLGRLLYGQHLRGPNAHAPGAMLDAGFILK